MVATADDTPDRDHTTARSPNVKMLLEREDIDVNIESRDPGYTALYATCGNGHTSTMKLLLQRPDILVNIQYKFSGHTPLMAAIIWRQTNVVEELLQHPDIDTKIQDAEGHTALYHAVNNPPYGDEFWESSLKEKIINILKERGAKVQPSQTGVRMPSDAELGQESSQSMEMLGERFNQIKLF